MRRILIFIGLVADLKAVGEVMGTGADYIGPGTGSLIIQVVLASLLGIGVAVRVYWKRLKLFFKRDKGEAVAEPVEEEE